MKDGTWIMGSTGYMADLQFYFALSVLYFAFGIGWGILCYRHLSELLYVASPSLCQHTYPSSSSLIQMDSGESLPYLPLLHIHAAPTPTPTSPLPPYRCLLSNYSTTSPTPIRLILIAALPLSLRYRVS